MKIVYKMLDKLDCDFAISIERETWDVLSSFLCVRCRYLEETPSFGKVFQVPNSLYKECKLDVVFGHVISSILFLQPSGLSI